MKAIKIFFITYFFITQILFQKSFAMHQNNQNIYTSKAIIASNFIKNVYLYAPKDDPLRIITRTLWHIFYNNESDSPTPTIKGIFAIITPEILHEIINHTQNLESKNLKIINSENLLEPTLEKNNIFAKKLIKEHDLYTLYAKYLPKEIEYAKKILEYLKNEQANLDKKLEINLNTIKNINEKFKKLEANFAKSIEESNKEKIKIIKDINKKFQKKSPEKEIEIEKIVKELNEKYGVNNFKKEKRDINQEIKLLQEEQLNIKRDINNINNEIENKNKEIFSKEQLSLNPNLLQLEVLSTINDLLCKFEKAYNSDIYPKNIIDAILLVFYESKFGKSFEDKIQNNFINQNNNFEKKLKILNLTEQINQLTKNYDKSFDSSIKITQGLNLPPEIKMGRFVYEQKNKIITEKFSDCFEASMLDLASIFNFNPTTGKYDPTIIKDELKLGSGYKKFIKILQITHLAKNNKLKEIDYSSQQNCQTFICTKKLKNKLNEMGFGKNQIKNINLSLINPSIVTDQIVRQYWINKVSGLNTIKYNQENLKCEILPLVNNFINILNFFYGTNATKVQDFDKILSYENKEKNLKRDFKFDLQDGDRPIITIKIMHQEQNKRINYSIKLTLMKHHTVLELKEREKRNNKFFGKFAAQLANYISKKQESFLSLTPFFILFTNTKTLKNLKSINNLSLILLTYYCQNIKDPKIQIKIAKHMLENNLLKHKNIKKLFLKLQNKLSGDIQLEYKLISYIIKTKTYLIDKELKNYLIQNSTKSLGVICNLDLNKNEFYELSKLFLDNGADINAKCEPNGYTLLQYAIKKNYTDLVKKLICEKKIEINKQGPENKTALHISAEWGRIEFIKLLLEHKDINTDLLDNKNNKPFNLAIENNKLETVKFIIKFFPTLTKPNLEKTPIHSACKLGNEKMLLFLLQDQRTNAILPDYNNNMPIHIAAFYGHTNLVKILADLPETNINKPGFKNRTALNLAVKNNKIETVKFLLKYKNPENVDQTPNNSSKIIDPNIFDIGFYTPLNRAVKNGNLEITKELLKLKKTDINLPDRWGYSPIFWAKNITILKELMTHQELNINFQDKRKKTALYWASTKGWTPMAKQLLTHKDIKPDIPNFLGKTPLGVALVKEHKEIANLIKSYKI